MPCPVIAVANTSASGTDTVGSSRRRTTVPAISSSPGSLSSRQSARRRVLPASSSEACFSGPDAAIIVRDAKAPVFSGEVAVSPACTLTAS
jgi:hypothetical protein